MAVALAAALALVIIGAVALAATQLWWLTPLASNWGSIDVALQITLVATGVAFVLINGFLAYVVIRYRAREGARALFFPDHPPLEKTLVVLTSIGIIVLIAPGLYFYAQAINPPADALEVEVLGFQWGWSYRYAGPDGRLGATDPRLMTRDNPHGLVETDPSGRDDIIVSDELRLPLDQPVRLLIRAQDVLHSVYVPHFRVKQDAVPGMVTHMWFTPTAAGTYEIACAEYCGVGHYAMRGVVVVVEAGEFEAWLASQPGVREAVARR